MITICGLLVLVSLSLPPCGGTCLVGGCWADPSRGVLLDLASNSTAAQLDWGIENTSHIGNLSCTERCSDRCFPGSFPYAPCTPTSDLGCAWPGEVIGVGNLQDATWPVIVGVRTVYFSSGSAIYRLDWGAHMAGALRVCGAADEHGSADGLDARFSASMGGMDHHGGVLYVCDTGNSAIRAVNLSTSGVSTLFNASHGLVAPIDIAFGPDGMAYVADPGSYVVHRFSLDSGARGLGWGLEVFGGVPGEYGIGEGPLPIVRFWDLSSIEVMGSTILVTERTQCTVRAIDIQSRVVRDLVGESNVCDAVCSMGGVGPPLPGRLCAPAYIRRWGETDTVYLGEWSAEVGFSNLRSINTTTMRVEDLGGHDHPVHFATGPDLQFVFRGAGVEPMPCDPGLVVDGMSLLDCGENLTTAGVCPGESMTPGCDEGCFGAMCEEHCSTSCAVEGEYIIVQCTEWSDVVCGTLSTPVVVGGPTLLPGELRSTGRVDSPKSMVHVNASLAYVADTFNQRILGFDPVENGLWLFSGVSEVPQWQDGAR